MPENPELSNTSSENQEINPSEPKPKEVKKFKRILWFAGGILLTLVVLLNVLIYFYLNPYLKYKICESVAINSDSLYRLEISTLKVRFLDASIQLEDINLYKDIQKWEEILVKKNDESQISLNLQVKSIKAEHIKWLYFLRTGKLEIGKISLKNPQIRLENHRSQNRPKNSRPIARQLQDFFGGFTEELKINRFLMSNAKVYFKLNTPIGLIFHQGESIDFDVKEFGFKMDSKLSSEKSLFWKDFDLNIKKYASLTPNRHYQIKAHEVDIKAKDSLMNIRNLRVLPNIDQYETYKTLDPRIRFHAKHISTEGLDFHRLIFKSEYDLYALKIQDARLESEYTQEPVETSARNGMPDFFARIAKLKKQLRKLPIYIRMDSLNLENFSFQFLQKKYINDSKPIGYHQADYVNLAFCKLALGKALDKLHISKPLYSENVNFFMRNYVYQTPDGFYKTYIQKTRISSSDSLAYLDEIHFEPMVSEAAFSASTYYQQMQIDARVKSIYANGLDVDKLVYEQQFVMGGIHLQKPIFKAYLDKQKPLRPGQTYQNFEQVLQSIPLYIDVDTFAIHQASFDYREKALIEDDLDLDEPSVIGVATHKAQNISLQVLHIALGKALNGSALSEIDTKNLQLSLSDYRYQSHTKSYSIYLQHLDVSSVRSYLRIDSLHLIPNGDAQVFSARQTYQVPWLNISVSTLEGHEIDFRKLLMYQEIDWGYLKLIRPQVNIYQDIRLPKRIKKNKSNKVSKEPSVFSELEYEVADFLFRISSKSAIHIPYRLILTKAFPKEVKKTDLRKILRNLPFHIKVDTLEVKNGFLDYQTQQYSSLGDGLEQHRAQEINFVIPKIRLGEATQDSTFSHFYSGNIFLTLRKYYYIDPDKQFYFTLDKVQSSLRDSILNIEDIVYQPLTPKRTDSINNKEYPNYIQAYLKSIRANAIDLDRLVFEQEFVVRALSVNQPQIQIYADRRTESSRKSKIKTLDDLLADIPIYMRIDTFNIKDAELVYEAEVALNEENKFGIAKHHLQKINFSLKKVELASKKTDYPLHPENMLLYSSDLQLDIKDYSYLTPNQKYRFEINHLQSFSQNSSLIIKGVSLKSLQSVEVFDKESVFQDTHYDISVREASARITDLRPMFDFKKFPLEKLSISGVNLDIYQNKTLPIDSNATQKQLGKLISKIPFSLSIDALSINDVKLKFRQKHNPLELESEEFRWTTHQADSAYLYAQGFVLDSSARAEESDFLFSKSLTFGLKNYYTFTPDELYRLYVGHLEVKSPDSTLSIKNLQFKPTVNDKAFMRLKVYQTDRFLVEADQVKFSNLHLNQFLNEGILLTDRLHIKDVKANVFRDKRISRIENFKPLMPQEVFQKINFDLRLDTISVENGKVTYGERVPKGRSTGEVFFSNINGQVFDIDNRAGQTDTMRLVASCQLMGAGLLTARFKMPLNTPHLYCTYHGSLGQMKADFFNRIIETNEYIQIRKGLIEQIYYSVIVRDTLATGTLNAGYKKLRINVLKEEDPEKRRKFITFVANLILKGRNNLQSKRARVGKIEYLCPKDTSFISMLWRSLATGLVDTLK